MAEVSVVVAARNQARWLGEAIDDVRQQTLEDWELVVVDDASTDGTEAVVARYAADSRIRYLEVDTREERAAARNRGIAATSGRYVAFLDADDRWRPEKLRKQVHALETHPDAALCYTPARFVDGAGRPLDVRKPPRAVAGRIFPRLLRGNVMILASVMVRRTALERVGGFDATLGVYGCEDWDLWLRLTREWPVTVVDEELTLYRRHDGNTAAEQVLASALVVVDKAYRDPRTPADARLSRAAARARLYWYHAGALALESRRAAVRPVLRALGEGPAAVLCRPALGALASLVLPRAAVGALRRLTA